MPYAVQAEGLHQAGQRGSTRRLVLTSAALLERRSDTYEVVERRGLGQVAALVRFIDQPQWMAVEWSDGARPTMYITPARDSLLTALMDAAQVCCVCWQMTKLYEHVDENDCQRESAGKVIESELTCEDVTAKKRCAADCVDAAQVCWVFCREHAVDLLHAAPGLLCVVQHAADSLDAARGVLCVPGTCCRCFGSCSGLFCAGTC